MQQIAEAQANPEVPINENFETLLSAGVFGKRHATSTALTWGFYGGIWNGVTVAENQTITLANDTINYVVVDRATGAVSVSAALTNWNNTPAYARAHKLTTVAGFVAAWEDHRCGLWGTHGATQRPPGVSADRGDTSQTLTAGTDATTQLWATELTADRAVTLSSTGAISGDRFRVVRTGLGAFTLDVGGLKTIPSATAAWAEVEFTGSAWVLTGYGTL